MCGLTTASLSGLRHFGQVSSIKRSKDRVSLLWRGGVTGVRDALLLRRDSTGISLIGERSPTGRDCLCKNAHSTTRCDCRSGFSFRPALPCMGGDHAPDRWQAALASGRRTLREEPGGARRRLPQTRGPGSDGGRNLAGSKRGNRRPRPSRASKPRQRGRTR